MKTKDAKGGLVTNSTVTDVPYSKSKYNSMYDCTGCATAMVNRTMIEGVQKRTTILEKKVDWVLYTIITTLIGVMMNLVILIGG